MSQDQPEEVPFTYLENDYLVVSVKLNDSVTKNFIVDTGIGITIISKSLCAQMQCKVDGEHVGKRMSGQSVKVPLSTAKSIQVGSARLSNFPIGVFDVEAMLPGADIGGFLSLGFFKDFPHTVDYQKRVIRFETPQSLKILRSTGTAVSVATDQQGHSFGVHMPLVLPDGTLINAEVDTGSQSLILHEKYMKRLGISPEDPKAKRREGKDETGHTYTRYFASLTGSIHLPGADHMKMDTPSVMFQKIIYDGLVGFYFLREFDVTYDLPNSEIIFNRPAR